MLTAPIPATEYALKRAGMTLDDIDLVEINEAFAAQVLACVEAWKSDDYCRQHLDLDGAMGDIGFQNVSKVILQNKKT